MSAIARLLPSVVLTTLIIAIIAGCASHSSVHRPGQVDTGDVLDQSIIVPSGHSALARGLRQALTKRGWRLQRYSSGRRRTDYEAMARRATYRLTLTDRPIGSCRNGGPAFHYSIALIENIGGEVPIAMAGADCLPSILTEFSADLDRKRLVLKAR